MAVPDELGLADLARRVAAGTASVRTLHEVFLASTVLCEAAEAPGFAAVGPVGAGLVPVFTSEAELNRARGPVAGFATTGADLLGKLSPQQLSHVLEHGALGGSR
jgi:hypothetical protein